MDTTNRLQAMLDDAGDRIAASEVYHFSQAARQSNSIITGIFYATGPVCLYATLPNGTHKSIVEAHMIGVYSSLKSHRLMYQGRML